MGGVVSVPLCKIYLRTKIVSRSVTAAVGDIPIQGVIFLLGNDIVGSRVILDPVVCAIPALDNPT